MNFFANIGFTVIASTTESGWESYKNPCGARAYCEADNRQYVLIFQIELIIGLDLFLCNAT